MEMLLAFLLVAFVAGASERGRRLLGRHSVFMLISVLVAASYYSIRIVQ